jgi:hypothetical protein
LLGRPRRQQVELVGHDPGELALGRGRQQVDAGERVLLAEQQDRGTFVAIECPAQPFLHPRHGGVAGHGVGRTGCLGQDEAAQRFQAPAAPLVDPHERPLELQDQARAPRPALAPAPGQKLAQLAQPPGERAAADGLRLR